MPIEKLIVLDHVQGPLQGSRQVLTRELHGVGTGDQAFIHFPSHRVPNVKPEHATLTRTGDSYQIAAAPGAPVFVNGLEVHVRMLSHGDLIRIGELGPLLRYREIKSSGDSPDEEEKTPGFKTMREVLDDCVQVAKADSSTAVGTGLRFLRSLPKGITLQASPLARAVTLGALLVIVVLLGTIMIRLSTLESRLARQAAEIVDSVGLVQEEARISVDEMSRIRDDLLSTTDRLTLLENESGDVAGMVGRVAQATVFIQAAYGFSDPNGRMLRATLGPGGLPIRDPNGQMIPTFGGEGPILERQYTGTAFIVSEEGLLLSNHHVAEPWLFDEPAKDALSRGFRPVRIKMIGYLPSHKSPFDVSFVEASPDADLALMRYDAPDTLVHPLVLSETLPVLGQSVMVIGYPTGIRALLARTDPAFVDSVLSLNPEPDFWDVARQLSDNGLVAPLITRGIVGQITPSAIVYDAETTHGGSGGPVISMDGRVVAVNTAIVGDFGGSNLGVPIQRAAELMPTGASTDR